MKNNMKNSMNKDNMICTDITIIGAGMSGLLSASFLNHLGINVCIIDQNDIFSVRNDVSDGRAIAIANNSKLIMEKYNAWDDELLSPGIIEQIRITNNYSPLFLHFDNALVDNVALGYMVEAHKLLNYLLNKIEDKVHIYSLSKLHIINQYEDYTEIILENGKRIHSKLCIAADGKFSSIRDILGIKTYSWEYGQSTITCTVKHELPHNNIAQEMFLSSGPFAILPLKDSNFSAVVWTLKNHIADSLMKMSQDKFNEYLKESFTDYLGEINLVGKRFTHKLGVKFTCQYYKNRVVLIGDAAHAIHPLAGQGFNLTINDLDVLSNLIKRYDNLQLDIGSSLLLSQYQRKRKFSNISMLAITDILNRLFSNDIAAIDAIRKIGISTVNNIPTLKKIFMNYAMGKMNILA